jgi:hypothetical protein
MIGVAVGVVVAVGMGDGVVWSTAVVDRARVTSETPIDIVGVAEDAGDSISTASFDWQPANPNKKINTTIQQNNRINNSQ